jgi:hypothetical protein
MNIGERRRAIEVEPITLPLPEALPIDEPAAEPAVEPAEDQPVRT